MNKLTRTRHLLILPALLLALLIAGCSGNNAESEAAEHLERADVYANQGQYRSALIELRNALQKDPENVAHALSLADIYLSVGAGDLALESLRPWQNDEPHAVAIPMARAHVMLGRHVSAEDILADFTPETPGETLDYELVRADIERLRGNYEASADQFAALLEANPDSIRAARGVISALIAQEELNQADQVASDWMSEHGKDSELLYARGFVAYQNNALESTSDLLTEALEELPSSDTFLPIRRQILTLLSRTATERGQMTDAQVYNRILAENTNVDLERGMETAMEAIGNGDLDTARSTLETLMQQNPNNSMVGMMLGAVALEQGDIEEGESLLTESIDAETSPVPFLQMMTMAQVDRGRREQALATLERALLARPSDVDLLAMHGVMALAEPDSAEDGVASLSKALEIDNTRTRLRMALAQHHLQNNRTEQALGQLRSAFSTNATDWPVTNFYLSTLVDNELDGEVSEVRDVLSSDHGDADFAQLLIALADYQLGDTSGSIQRLEQLTSGLEGSWAEPHQALAGLYRAEGRNSDAIEQYVMAARRNPAQPAPLQEATRLYLSSNNVSDTSDWLNDIANRAPALAPPANTIAADLFLQSGDLQAARQRIDRISTSETDYQARVRARILTAEAEQAQADGNYNRAASKLAEAISLQPDNQGYRLLLARTKTAAQEFGAAQETLDLIREDFGRSAAWLVTQAQLTEQRDGVEEAYNYLSAEWRNDPASGMAQEMLRLSARAAPEDMRSIAERWTELQPNNAQAWQVRGDMALGDDDRAAAIEAYREALNRNPNNVIALNNLAWVLGEEEDPEAIELAARAAELAPDNAAVLDTYGWILFRQGDPEQAKEILRQAKELDPDNSDIAQHLATVEEAL